MQLTLSAPKIWFYREAVDFRRAIDGLVGLIHAEMEMEPRDGIFVFRNRSKDKLKILAWHGNGFILLYKRMERGKFSAVADGNAHTVTLDEKELSWLLAGLDWVKMRNWNTLSFDDYC